MVTERERAVMADSLLLRALQGKAKTVNLSGKKLQRVPGAVGQLVQLEVLLLKNNRISDLPEEIIVLPKLTELNLGNNFLEKVPEQLQHVRSLQKLHLFANRITSLPAEVCYGLENLTVLNLNNNRLRSLPAEIYSMSNLKRLSLNSNQLESLPKQIGLLQNLSQLHVANNQLKMLPDTVGYMTSLRKLYLSRNELAELPEEFAKLQHLRILDVAGNQIRSFPSKILQVPLKELYCEENPLLQKIPVHSLREEEMLSLAEITARFILKDIKCVDTILRLHMKLYPEVRGILSKKNDCAICGQGFLNMWLECVKFVPRAQNIRISLNVHLLPIKVFLCSYKCFNRGDHGLYGVAML